MAESRVERPGRTRLIVMGAMACVILAAVNLQIVGKERIVRDGTTVLLRLAPRDPRSLLQGDYMALRYSMANEVARAAEAEGVTDGQIVIGLGERQEARFVAIHDGRTLAANQHLLQFRKRGETVRLASDAFFFEEGQSEVYRNARFGELRVAEDGDAVLTGLRDSKGEPVRPPND